MADTEKEEQLERRIQRLEEELKELVKKQEEAEEEEVEVGEGDIREIIGSQLAVTNPDLDIEVSISDTTLTIFGRPKMPYLERFPKKFKIEVEGDVKKKKELMEKFTERAAEGRMGGEYTPSHLLGGLKLVFKCSHTDKVIDVIEEVTGFRLSEFSVVEGGKGICFLQWDLRRTDSGYQPTNQKMGHLIPDMVDALKEEVDLHVDTSTGEDPETDMVFPIDYDNIVFTTGEEITIGKEEIEKYIEEEVEEVEKPMDRLVDRLSEELK